ncbi:MULTISPECIES: GNAT family N-acetyltransferase [Salinispora]|uniref:GNAT family N-acetyltransferase n=1 Tax=Salinispora TaxID=168694 RepID=UPI000381330E|nr:MULTISPECIES: GNAT family protein [Salinispora]
MYPVRIEGGRIVLREFEERDLEASMTVVGDPDVTVFLSFDTRTREEQAERLAADIARAKTEPRPDYYLAIADRQADELIGFIRIGLGGHRSGELGYAIRKDRWRQGYAVEAAQLMLGFGFEALALHRIQAACGPDNLASQALLHRLGFECEGRMRDHVFTNGGWRDSLLYATLHRPA